MNNEEKIEKIENSECENCEGCENCENEVNSLIMEWDEESFKIGVKEASEILGFGAVLNNLGLTGDLLAELMKVKLSCDTDLKIAKLNSKVNL